jgi:preprotein translocase subunit SecE
VADREEFDSTPESGDPAVDPAGVQAGGSHALEPTEPAVAGVPADAEEPTFRDRERLVAAADERDAGDLRDGDTDLDDSHLDDADRDDRTLDDNDQDGTEPGDKELVAVGATPRQGSADAEGDLPPATRARLKKEKATARQKQVAVKERRTGPVQFVKESVSELQKVVYPTGQQLINYFIVVLIFVLFIIAIVSVLDLAFGKAIIAIFS